MKMYLALTIALLACVAATAAPLSYPVFRAPAAIVVDGEVQQEAAWQGAPSVTGFSKLGAGYTNAKQSAAQMLWDDQGLYIAVVCEEPDAALLKPVVRDYGDTWAEDSLEIFLQPALQAYQIAVTAGGAKGGFEGGPDVSKIKAAAKIGPDFYSIEVFVPFSVVKATTKAGDKWRGEICRNCFTSSGVVDKFTSWTPLQARFLEPDNFATLAFSGETSSAEQVKQLTEQLNLPYRQTVAASMKAAAEIGAQYKGTLQEAQEDAAMGERARGLLREWRTIERLSKQTDTASILDLRHSLMQLQELNQASYELKYKYLISKLLSEN
ncbi:MAG: carbohydrate-binding family 9-like protein [Armatimonadota bacterium]